MVFVHGAVQRTTGAGETGDRSMSTGPRTEAFDPSTACLDVFGVLVNVTLNSIGMSSADGGL